MTVVAPPPTPDARPQPSQRRWWLPASVLTLVLLVGVGAWLVLRDEPDTVSTWPAAGPTVTPSPTASASVPAAPVPTAPVGPTAVDCSVVPDRTAFTVGASHPCFTQMGERFVVWLGANTHRTASAYVPSPTFSAVDVDNVKDVQRLMGDAPDGWLGAAQWTRLLSHGPPPATELRANGIGALWFGMTAAQVEASGVATMRAPGADDPDPALSVELPGVAAYGCYRTDDFYAVLVKGPSDVRTVEGITTSSSVSDLQAAYGDRLLTRTVDFDPDWVDYAVYEGDYGYAFFPQEDGSLMMVAGTRDFIDTSGGGPHGLC
jgi:hypothetical protein